MEIRIKKGFREVIIHRITREGVERYEVFDSLTPQGSLMHDRGEVHNMLEEMLIE